MELRSADHKSDTLVIEPPRLTQQQLVSNNSFQSAYIKHNSNEITFVSVHDHIIKAMGRQHVTCLTLLDLSAAFDTIDHSILFERLTSWFCITYQLLSLGFNLTSSIVLSMLTLNTLNNLFFSFSVVFLKDQSLALYSSFYTPLL